jgi:hypothetical protein
MLPNRVTLADIDIGGTTIPEHSALTLVQAELGHGIDRARYVDSRVLMLLI